MKTIFTICWLVLGMAAQAQDPGIPRIKMTQLDSLIRNSDRPLVVNFWSTTCKPCVAEIPYFQTLVKKYEADSVQLWLVSLDMPEAYPHKISAFASKHQFVAPILWLDETNADYFCPIIDPSWSGAIPATVFIHRKTGYRHFQEMKITPEKLDQLLKQMLKPAL